MPKLIAPHGASWRGRALAAWEIVDADDGDVRELLAHGFRELPGTADVPSASCQRPDADGTSAVPGTLSRNELIRLLRGKGVNLFVSTDALRALAAKHCAASGGAASADTTTEVNESQTEELKVPHGDE